MNQVSWFSIKRMRLQCSSSTRAEVNILIPEISSQWDPGVGVGDPVKCSLSMFTCPIDIEHGHVTHLACEMLADMMLVEALKVLVSFHTSLIPHKTLGSARSSALTSNWTYVVQIWANSQFGAKANWPAASANVPSQLSSVQVNGGTVDSQTYAGRNTSLWL